MRKTMIRIVAGLALASAQAGAVTPDDFKVETTRDLMKLCGVNPDHALYDSARAFCLGYLDAAWDCHEALTAGENFDPIACPGPKVTRDQAMKVFAAWAEANPQSLDGETPVNGVMRAVSEKWPCSGQ